MDNKVIQGYNDPWQREKDYRTYVEKCGLTEDQFYHNSPDDCEKLLNRDVFYTEDNHKDPLLKQLCSLLKHVDSDYSRLKGLIRKYSIIRKKEYEKHVTNGWIKEDEYFNYYKGSVFNPALSGYSDIDDEIIDWDEAEEQGYDLDLRCRRYYRESMLPLDELSKTRRNEVDKVLRESTVITSSDLWDLIMSFC
jgi:hypothetical protein